MIATYALDRAAWSSAPSQLAIEPGDTMLNALTGAYHDAEAVRAIAPVPGYRLTVGGLRGRITISVADELDPQTTITRTVSVASLLGTDTADHPRASAPALQRITEHANDLLAFHRQTITDQGATP